MFVIEGMDDEAANTNTNANANANEAPRSEAMSVSNLELRRAVLGILLLGARAMDLGEIERELRAIGIVTRPRSARGSNQVLSDLLGYQSRLGRVRRVSQGIYVAVPEALSISMRWRCQRIVIVRLSALRPGEP